MLDTSFKINAQKKTTVSYDVSIYRIERIARNYLQRLVSDLELCIPETNIDVFETIYSENYACSNAAIILAYEIGNGKQSKNMELLLAKTLDRCVNIMNDPNPTTSAFCRLFIFHFSAMSILILPDSLRSSYVDKYLQQYQKYNDSCNIINANSAATKISNYVFLAAMESRVISTEEQNQIDILLAVCGNMDSGFINDAKTPDGEKDGMPIAYHGFILFLLGTALHIGKKYGVLSELLDEKLQRIISNGITWLGNAMPDDGSAAFSGRSRYQVFTWGVIVFLKILGGYSDTSVLKSLIYLEKYKKNDGSYSCTPNYFDHNLRIGFEKYTHVNMYNNLCVSALCMAALVAKGKASLIENIKLPDETHYIDYGSGYAFYRNNFKNPGCSVFFACAIREHYNGDTKALGGFHFRHSEYFTPLAESNIKSAVPLFEGVCFTYDNKTRHYVTASKNIEAEKMDNGYAFVIANPGYRARKEISFAAGVITWSYTFKFEKPVAELVHHVPLVLNDGKEQMRVYKPDTDIINMQMYDCLYQLSCNNGKADIDLNRCFDSPSGVSANAEIIIKPSNGLKKEFLFETHLFFAGKTEIDKSIFTLKNIESQLFRIEYKIEKNMLFLKAITIEDELNYSWNVYLDGKLYATQDYKAQNSLSVDLSNAEAGHLSAELHTKSAYGHIRTKSIFINCVDKDLIPCPKEKCTGCFACRNICPNQCITYALDDKGVKYPQIEKAKCKQCRLCKRICPAKNDTASALLRHDNCYAAWNNDETARLASSSGGMFPAFSKYVIENGGVVYGAYYDCDFNVKIGDSDSIDVKLFSGSKYVESDSGESYKLAAQQLGLGRIVLFSGAPCQIAGLKAYLRKDYSNLYTIDFICGGFVGEAVFKYYINALEIKESCALKEFSFTNKASRWERNLLYLAFENGNCYYIKPQNDPYYSAYQIGDTVRDNCFNCPYLAENHKSDIIIGDYNGWRNMENFNYDTKKGISQVIINTQKGMELFEKICSSISYESRDISEVATGNKRYNNLRDSHSKNSIFWKMIEDKREKYFVPLIELSNINEVSVDIIYDAGENLLKAKASAELSYDDGVTYAWYIYCDNNRIDTIWYKPEYSMSYKILKPGEYYVRVFVKEGNGNKKSVCSKKIAVAE